MLKKRSRASSRCAEGVREREKVGAGKGRERRAGEREKNEKKRRISGDGSGTVVAESLVSRVRIPVYIETNVYHAEISPARNGVFLISTSS